jgi:hypothetical protein
MDPTSFIWAIVVVVVVLYAGKILSHSFRLLFYFLLTLLILVFVFGISFNDIFSLISDTVVMLF